MADAKMPEKLGRYEVIRELGKGAMGVVYEGKDPNIGRRVAIKTARREIVDASGMADEMMERFLREAQAAGALNHPNIITIFDAAEENGIAYIAMEYLEGGDLGDVIESKRRLGMDEIVEIGANICEALNVAHNSGVVHRDIKPANILMPTGQPLKVADFGIAHVSDSNLTQDGALIGTPHYMSPEQFMGQKLDGRSDLFSVGNILYELTTGEKPFGGEALSTVMHHVIKTDPVNPTELNFNVPDALAQVIMKALSKRPAQRYKTGNEMAAALRESVKENPNPAILDPSKAIAMEATLAGAGAAPVAQQGTVIGGTPPTAQQGTVMGGAPPNEDLVSTVAGARPSSQETTIAEGPPAMGATAPGGAPAPAGTVTDAPPVHVDAPKGGNKGLLIGGGVAATLVVVIAAVLMSGGEKAPSDSGATSPPPSAAANTGTEATANYYSLVSFNILRARELSDYRAFDNGEITLDDLNGKVDDVDNEFSIEILNTQDTLLGELKYEGSGSYLEFTADQGANNLRYRAEIPAADGSGEVVMRRGEIPPAEAPDASATIEILLPPAGS